MRTLTEAEVDMVAGGRSGSDWTTAAYAIIGIGLAGGVATGLFGLAVGGSMLYVDYNSR